MRMPLTTYFSYWPVLFVSLVGVAYIWVVSALLDRQHRPSAEIPTAKKAA